MKEVHRKVVIAMADHDMRTGEVAWELGYHRNTIMYRLAQIEKEHGLNPRSFRDLCKLVEMAEAEEKENKA